MACKDCRYGGMCWKQHELLSTAEENEMLDCFEDDRDFVEVVRCKDCEYDNDCFIQKSFNVVNAENPFCCLGKRKEVTADG